MTSITHKKESSLGIIKERLSTPSRSWDQLSPPVSPSIWKLMAEFDRHPSCIDVLHIPLILIISRCCFAEAVKEMYHDVKRTCKACRAAVFELIKPIVLWRFRSRSRSRLLCLSYSTVNSATVPNQLADKMLRYQDACTRDIKKTHIVHAAACQWEKFHSDTKIFATSPRRTKPASCVIRKS